MVAVVDYGMGNLGSVMKACEHLGVKAKIAVYPEDIVEAEKIVFPGVGNFSAAMHELKKRNLIEPLKDAIDRAVPFLGICLGMQLLLESSQEAPGVKGLGVIKGKVVRFKSSKLIVPHMGWNSARITRRDPLYKNIKDGSYFYFANSYYCQPKDKAVALTVTDYGINFASSLQQDKVWGVQFHPEKSQSIGMKVFENFLKLCK